METVRDKIVLITGASSGIGASTAVLFAKYGSRLALTGRNKDNLEKVVKECVKQGLAKDKILTVTGDLCKEADVKKIMTETIDYFKSLDVLVNNTGIYKQKNLEEIAMEEFDELMNVNVRSAVALTKLAIPHLKASKGSVVNVSSFLSMRGMVGAGAYCVTKAALDMFTSVLSLELGPVGVRVNSVNPGVTASPLWEKVGLPDLAKFYESIATLAPLQKIGVPGDMAQAIVFLASDAASFITGAILPVDGGYSTTASWFPQEKEAILSKDAGK